MALCHIIRMAESTCHLTPDVYMSSHTTIMRTNYSTYFCSIIDQSQSLFQKGFSASHIYIRGPRNSSECLCVCRCMCVLCHHFPLDSLCLSATSLVCLRDHGHGRGGTVPEGGHHYEGFQPPQRAVAPGHLPALPGLPAGGAALHEARRPAQLHQG